MLSRAFVRLFMPLLPYCPSQSNQYNMSGTAAEPLTLERDMQVGSYLNPSVYFVFANLSVQNLTVNGTVSNMAL